MLSRVYTQSKVLKNGCKYTSCSRTEKKVDGKEGAEVHAINF